MDILLLPIPYVVRSIVHQLHAAFTTTSMTPRQTVLQTGGCTKIKPYTNKTSNKTQQQLEVRTFTITQHTYCFRSLNQF